MVRDDARTQFKWKLLRTPCIHIKIVVVHVGSCVVSATCRMRVVVTAVLEFGREDTLRPLRLPRLLDSRQTNGRALAEREVGL